MIFQKTGMNSISHNAKRSFKRKSGLINLYHKTYSNYSKLSQAVDELKRSHLTELNRTIPLSNNVKFLLFSGISFLAMVKGVELIR